MPEPTTPQLPADPAPAAPFDENSASSAPVFVEHLDSEEGALADVFRDALNEQAQQQVPPPAAPEAPAPETPPPAPSDASLQPPQPPAPPAPAPAYDPDQYEEVDPDEIARKARLAAERAAAGRFGGEKQRLMAEIASLRAQLATAPQSQQPQQPQQTPHAQPSTPPQADPNAPVTDQELAAVCGPRWESVLTREDAEAEVRKQRAIYAYYGAPRPSVSPQDIDAIVERRLQQMESARRTDDFRSRVLAPEGFAELERNARSNGFADFLDAPMPDTSMTRRDVINIALWQMGQSSDPAVFDKAVSTVQGFYRQFAASKTAPQPAARPAGATIDPSRYIAPSAPSGSSAPASPGKYSQKQVDDYLDKANKAGTEEYEKALAWVFEQDAAGHIAH